MANQETVKVNVNELETIKCDKCQSTLFASVFALEKIPFIHSPNGKNSLSPIQLYECSSCGNDSINDKLFEQIKSLDLLKCDKCDSIVFAPVFLLKNVPFVHTGTGNDELLPIQLFECARCGDKDINKEIIKLM